MENSKKKVNYSLTEKSLLLSIVRDFKNIIENKKTDAVTWKEKDAAWHKICSIFNSKSLEGVFRAKESLRKLYENLKKNVRKVVADEKKVLVCTGGGPPPEKKPKYENDIKEQILSIVNTKTIYGLSNNFDGDSMQENVLPETTHKTIQPGCISKDRDYYDLSDNEHSYAQFSDCVVEEIVLTSAPKRNTLMNTEINNDDKPEGKIETMELAANRSTYGERDNVIVDNRRGDFKMFKTKKDETLRVDGRWSSRRKPIIKETVGTDLKKEYSSLAQVKLELYNEELKLAKVRNQREEELHDFKKESLLLEIRKKKLEIMCLEKNINGY